MFSKNRSGVQVVRLQVTFHSSTLKCSLFSYLDFFLTLAIQNVTSWFIELRTWNAVLLESVMLSVCLLPDI